MAPFLTRLNERENYTLTRKLLISDNTNNMHSNYQHVFLTRDLETTTNLAADVYSVLFYTGNDP